MPIHTKTTDATIEQLMDWAEANPAWAAREIHRLQHERTSIDRELLRRIRELEDKLEALRDPLESSVDRA